MPLTDDKTFKTAVTLVLASLTFLTSLIVILNVQASNRGAAASRDGRLLDIQLLNHLGRSRWDATAEEDVMNTYGELALRMSKIRSYEAYARGDDALYYEASRDRLAKLQGSLEMGSDVMRPPYFDPKTKAFDYIQFDMDRVSIRAAELQERQELKKAEGRFWGAKSNAFTTGLATMAVAVFLLTLSLVLTGKIRLFMAGAGLVLIMAVLAVSGLTAVRRWKGPSDEAIKLMARASGPLYWARYFINTDGDFDAGRSFAEQAAAEIDKALLRDPDYPAALLVRSRIHEALGEISYFSGRIEESRRDLEKAAADMERILQVRKTDGYLCGSLGYTQLLLGRLEASARSEDQALRFLPRQKVVYGTSRAVALLFNGKRKEAEALLEDVIDQAYRIPLASDPASFRTLIKNLERFNEIRPVEGLPEMIKRLKEASVCLTILKTTRPSPVKAKVATPGFVAPVYNESNKIVDLPACLEFPRGSVRAHFLFEFKELERDRSVVSKVYRRTPGRVFWIEQQWLGYSERWARDSEGRLLRPIQNSLPESDQQLAGGDYRLEIYVDGNLLATATFKVL